jgi:hypothetical protein
LPQQAGKCSLFLGPKGAFGSFQPIQIHRE